ncbi:hypothetical protein FN846DRAFT_423632 [Sphaerosporella brunnea]|uniref:Cyclin-D1-binding protein 1-like N-terminal domain-containing protein n=1 Tax=Sphaerosporella brunnea TaxID=1250544 RepID=A0A5J5EG29_9PEZI|nr:hypothetical protein FN846DRAFT_423632 [Sphaerosporella brunnea]
MPSSSSSSSVAAPLAASFSTLTSLIAHCRASLLAPTTSTPPPSSSSCIPEASAADALEHLHAAATLAKAQITRLSVALKPPATADAAEKFVREFSATIVPSLAAAAAAVDAAAHGKALAKEVRRAVDALLASIAEYVAAAAATGGADRLAATGVVWCAADAVLRLRDLGLCGVVDAALRECGEMVEDARAELKAWVDGEGAGAGDAEDGDEWDFPAAGRKGALDAAVKCSAEHAVRKMKLVTILFGAARKRRLLGDARLSRDPQRVDGIADVSKEISALVDDLGTAFYEDEAVEVDQAREKLVTKAVALAELCVLGNTGEKDAYSGWFENCKSALQKSS